MSVQPPQLTIAIFSEAALGRANFDHLQALQKARMIEVIDIALVQRDNQGKLGTTSSSAATPRKGARRGLAAGTVIGVLFPPSLIVSAAVGAAAGGAIAKLREPELDPSRLPVIGNELGPQESALIIIATNDATPRIVERLSGHAHLHQQPIDESALA